MIYGGACVCGEEAKTIIRSFIRFFGFTIFIYLFLRLQSVVVNLIGCRHTQSANNESKRKRVCF